ncbi:MAG: SpoIID/LytB domain-containing protein [Bacteroidales bacterium]|nr:SpoIID/LytB domain-containing protein [Bacteroidales bacterium]
MNVEVGILTAPLIRFSVPEGRPVQENAGAQSEISGVSKILEVTAANVPDETIEGPFTLHDVVIGVDFHWQRTMSQTFAGALKFVKDGDNVTAVNIIDIEDYLLSVISSEMKATADLEFLKAHAIISRSWLLAQILARRSMPKVRVAVQKLDRHWHEEGGDAAELVKWFDHEDHKLFDVCADDHCQRYQGMQMAVGEAVRKAIDQTRGVVLTYKGNICDARFHKCCGGRTERFSACWEDNDYDYLRPVDDPWCDTRDEDILSKVLNDYDLETKDFHDWTVRYGSAELSELVRRRSGIDFGTIIDLEPLERGDSGRIIRLRIVGTEKTLIIGKELLIRRFLSESHLKSSNFDIRREGDDFVLTGHGWGHGVGLCQIGAAVMAANGFSCEQILSHYYPGAQLTVYGDEQ